MKYLAKVPTSDFALAGGILLLAALPLTSCKDKEKLAIQGKETVTKTDDLRKQLETVNQRLAEIGKRAAAVTKGKGPSTGRAFTESLPKLDTEVKMLAEDEASKKEAVDSLRRDLESYRKAYLK